MDLLQAIILGVVQGLTEFIPVSSTAHLVFASRWVNLYGGNAEADHRDHGGHPAWHAIAAVFVYFAFDIFAISGRRLFATISP